MRGARAGQRLRSQDHAAAVRAHREDQQSTWTPAGSQPPDVGVVEDSDHIVSFKTGGPTGEETLIADGDFSDDNDAFGGTRTAKGHDHYGPSGNTTRGKYTGPGHLSRSSGEVEISARPHHDKTIL